MVRLAAFLLLAPAATAFTTINSHQRIERLAAAPQYSDYFDAPTPFNPQSEGDECYLGKYGQHDDCVDFGTCQLPFNIASQCIFL
jgi:hypothetical protein